MIGQRFWRWLRGLGAVWALAVCCAAAVGQGQPFMNVVGPPPDPRTLAFKTWLDDLIAHRLTELPLERSTTVYVSSSYGDDSEDGLQPQTAVRTLARVQRMIDESQGDIRFRFLAGDEWREPRGLVLNKPNITLDSWGSGPRPLFNAFTRRYVDTSWVKLSGNRWFRVEVEDIAWVRAMDDRLGRPMERCATPAEVAHKPWSFHYDPMWRLLYVNTSDVAFDPNTLPLEGVVSNQVDGVRIEADGCRVEGLRGDGWGMHRTIVATQRQPFTSAVRHTQRALVVDCAGYYSGHHVIAVNVGGGWGGFTTFVGCVAGFPKYSGGVETVFNAYISQGYGEVMFIDCDAVAGTLPASEWMGTQESRGIAFLTHTGSLHIPLSLVVMSGCRLLDNPVAPACDSLMVLDSLHDPGFSPEGFRAFVVDCVQERTALARLSGGGHTWGRACLINNRFELRPNLGEGMVKLRHDGFDPMVINTVFDIDCSAVSGANMALYKSTYGLNGPRLYHCEIKFKNIEGAPTTGMDLDVYYHNSEAAPGKSGPGQMMNCIVSASSSTGGVPTGTHRVAFNNNAERQRHNAYFGWGTKFGAVRGWSNDPGMVELVAVPALEDRARAVAGLIGAGDPAAGVEYDMLWRPRPAAPSIGALEPAD